MESGAGLLNKTQCIPLAQAFNFSTGALFGFNQDSYDKKKAEEVKNEVNKLRDSGEQS